MISVSTIEVDTDLVLRPIMPLDAVDIFKMVDRERDYLGVWLPFVAATTSVDYTLNFLNSILNADAEKNVYVYTIRYQDEFTGVIGFKASDVGNEKTEIGYWMGERFQHRGIMTRCVQKLCKRAFNEMDINRIQIKCAVGNLPSNAIPERLGFTLEGIERDGELLSSGQFTDLKVYSKLKSEL